MGGDADGEMMTKKYIWDKGICIPTADCGADVTDEKTLKTLLVFYAAAGVKEGDKIYWECGAATLAASIITATSIAFTM